MVLLSCAAAREAISARADGEPTGAAPDALAAHVAACADCAAHADGVAALDRRLRVAPAPEVPDLSGPIVTAARAEHRDGRRRRDLRALVALAGVAQLLLATPALLGWLEAGAHVGRDLGAFQAALGVGFVLAARRPTRAAGVLPIAGVAVCVILAAVAVDLVVGRAAPLAELSHLAEVVGVLALWRLGRSEPRPRSEPARPAAVSS